MILTSLTLMISDPTVLLDAADDANLAHTQCVFATERAALRDQLPADQLASKLERECAAQARALRTISGRIFRLRGDARPESKAAAMIDDLYRKQAAQYRSLPEIERKLKEVSQWCEVNPAECRN